jgi:hypothetical protein
MLPTMCWFAACHIANHACTLVDLWELIKALSTLRAVHERVLLTRCRPMIRRRLTKLPSRL